MTAELALLANLRETRLLPGQALESLYREREIEERRAGDIGLQPTPKIVTREWPCGQRRASGPPDKHALSRPSVKKQAHFLTIGAVFDLCSCAVCGCYC